VKRSLGAVSRGLLAASFVTLLVAICPCFPEASLAMEDCCPSSGLSAASGCCDQASRAEAAVYQSPAPAPMTSTPITVASDGPAPYFSPLVASALPPLRPVVARAILRV
jgi:hypothetical protein